MKWIKDIVTGNIKKLYKYEKEEDNYYKPVKVNNFGVIITLNTKVTIAKVKYYKLNNILIKLYHI